MTVPVVMYTLKDFYLLDVFNEKIEILKAAGLIDHWNLADVNKALLNYKVKLQPKVLNLSHLRGIFELLFFGCISSFVVFFFEVMTPLIKKAFRVK